MERKNWDRKELIVAFNLYCKTPFGKIHTRNPDVIHLAKALGRTPSAVSWKLANFASLDPLLKKRNIVGATHGGKLEKQIWEEFNNNWEQLSFESERLRFELLQRPIVESEEEMFPEGKTREAVVRARVNQGFFRAAVMAAYNSTCCITGLAVSELLCASHIVPWAIDHKNRTNPRNGLCLSAIHDRAFDRGLLTISINHEVLVSPRFKDSVDPAIRLLLTQYDGARIITPDRFTPDQEFLRYHHRHIFKS